MSKRKAIKMEEGMDSIVIGGVRIKFRKEDVEQVNPVNLERASRFHDLITRGVLYAASYWKREEIEKHLAKFPNLQSLEVISSTFNDEIEFGKFMSVFRQYYYRRSMPVPTIVFKSKVFQYAHKTYKVKINNLSSQGVDQVRAPRALVQELITKKDDGTNEYDATVLTMKRVMHIVLRNL